MSQTLNNTMFASKSQRYKLSTVSCLSEGSVAGFEGVFQQKTNTFITGVFK